MNKDYLIHYCKKCDGERIHYHKFGETYTCLGCKEDKVRQKDGGLKVLVAER